MVGDLGSKRRASNFSTASPKKCPTYKFFSVRSHHGKYQKRANVLNYTGNSYIYIIIRRVLLLPRYCSELRQTRYNMPCWKAVRRWGVPRLSLARVYRRVSLLRTSKSTNGTRSCEFGASRGKLVNHKINFKFQPMRRVFFSQPSILQNLKFVNTTLSSDFDLTKYGLRSTFMWI